MIASVQRANRSDIGELVDIRSVRDPLEFLAAEHFRQRKICADLDTLALPGGGDIAMAKMVLTHIVNAMPMHMLDEEDDLFPLLRRRAEPDDEIEKILTRLGKDHLKVTEMTGEAVEILELMMAEGCAAAGENRSQLAVLAAHERRHLLIENAILLPLAKARLTANDRRTLALRMAARRGIILEPLEPSPTNA